MNNMLLNKFPSVSKERVQLYWGQKPRVRLLRQGDECRVMNTLSSIHTGKVIAMLNSNPMRFWVQWDNGKSGWCHAAFIAEI